MSRLEGLVADGPAGRFALERDLLAFRAVRSSGPGGQNVNKVSSKVVLTYAFEQSALPEFAKEKLRQLHARLDAEGQLCIRSDGHRDQSRNLEDACFTLCETIAAALTRPKKRKPTKPTFGGRQRRLNDKKKQSEKKSSRAAQD